MQRKNKHFSHEQQVFGGAWVFHILVIHWTNFRLIINTFRSNFLSSMLWKAFDYFFTFFLASHNQKLFFFPCKLVLLFFRAERSLKWSWFIAYFPHIKDNWPEETIISSWFHNDVQQSHLLPLSLMLMIINLNDNILLHSNRVNYRGENNTMKYGIIVRSEG